VKIVVIVLPEMKNESSSFRTSPSSVPYETDHQGGSTIFNFFHLEKQFRFLTHDTVLGAKYRGPKTEKKQRVRGDGNIVDRDPVLLLLLLGIMVDKKCTRIYT
jgi:hypothetical protein